MKLIRFFSICLFFTLFVSTFTRRRAHSRRTSAPNTIYDSFSGWNSADGGVGNIFYLDRQDAKCSTGAMSYFQMHRSGNNVRYYLSCLKSSAISDSATALYTGFNATSGKKCVNYLDRHNVVCPNGSVISGFKLERNPSNTSQIRYRYYCKPAQTVCCNSFHSSKQDMGDKSIWYLDRQHIGMNDSKTHAMQQFRLRTSYNPDQMWYDYTMCKLMDLDAVQAVKTVEATLQASTAAAQAAAQELASAKAAKKQLEQQLQNLQSQITQTTQAVEAAQAKSDAANQKVSQDTVNLTAAKASPGLTC